MVSLESLFGKESAWKMRNAGLHKLVSSRLQKEGHAISDDFDMHSAIRTLGTNVYIKNAEFKNVIDGLTSLNALIGEK